MGGERAYLDLVVISCHVKVAMGLVAPLLRIGGWSGVGYLDGMAYLRYSGCPIGRMRVVSSSANVGLFSMYIY